MTGLETSRSIFTNPIEGEELYFKMIDAAAAARQDSIISNGKPAHAVYLLYTFLTNAKKNVKIYTGKLAQSFNGVLAYADPKLAEAAIRFLQKDESSLSIIVADELDLSGTNSNEKHPFIEQILQSEPRGKFTVSTAMENLSPPLDFHFLVMDKGAFRIEMEPEQAKALVNFKNPDFADALSSLFAIYEKSCKPLYATSN